MEIVIPLIIIAVIIMAVIGHHQNKARRAALAAFAASEGLQFDATRQRGMEDVYPGFDLFRRGSGRYAENFMTGSHGNCGMSIFEYHYQTQSGSGKRRSTQHHRYTVIMLQPPFPLRPLSVRPEGWWDKLTAAFGWDDIDFESAEFSRRFHVKSPDRRWAFDVLTARTIEFLMGRKELSLEMDDRQLMVPLRGRIEPPAILDAMATGIGVLEGIPQFAREAN